MIAEGKAYRSEKDVALTLNAETRAVFYAVASFCVSSSWTLFHKLFRAQQRGFLLHE